MKLTKTMGDELAKEIIMELGLDSQGVQGITIKMAPQRPTTVVVELVARDELETFIGTELKSYELTKV
jgi:hypothetical protein